MRKEMLKKTLLLASSIIVVAVILQVLLVCQFILNEDLLMTFVLIVLVLIGSIYRYRWYGKVFLLVAIVIFMMVIVANPLFIISIICLFVGVLVIWKNLLLDMYKRFEQIITKNQLTLTQVDTQKYGRIQTRDWWTVKHTLSSEYEWDDIHLVSWFGDTTIDLTNTILPEDTSIIVIHKAIGDVRIIAPLGVGISLNHSTLRGNVLFETEDYRLRNNQLSVYSENFIVANRKLKIVTTIYVGNLEVIRI